MAAQRALSGALHLDVCLCSVVFSVPQCLPHLSAPTQSLLKRLRMSVGFSRMRAHTAPKQTPGSTPASLASLAAVRDLTLWFPAALSGQSQNPPKAVWTLEIPYRFRNAVSACSLLPVFGSSKQTRPSCLLCGPALLSVVILYLQCS